MPTLHEVRLEIANGEVGGRSRSIVQADYGAQGSAEVLLKIDALDDLPGVDMLSASGLTQRTFEYLVTRYPDKFVAMEFWNCTRVGDLAPIEALRSAACLLFHRNGRATRLWDLRKSTRLRGLMFEDFPKLRDLSDLQHASGVTELEFGNMITTRQTYRSLEPLGALGSLEQLRFDAIAIEDDRIQPLAKLQQLKEIVFPPRLFTRHQVAWLKARLPRDIAGGALGPFRSVAAMPGKSGRVNDTLIVGRGERACDAARDRAKLSIKASEFQALVDFYAANPGSEPLEA